MPMVVGNGSITGLNVGGLPAGTVNTASLAAGSVSTATLASGAVTADAMASTLDLSSKTVSLGITSGANYIRIADTGTVSSGSSLTIDNCFSTTYNLYQVNVFCLGTTNESTVYGLNYRTGGGSGSDYSSNYTWRRYRNYNGHTSLEIDAATGDSSFSLNLYNRSDYGFHLSAWIYMPANSSFLTNMWGQVSGTHPGNTVGFPHSIAGHNSAFNTFTGIRFFARSAFTGSFSNARMIVYALRN